jgi:hypothetical protein
LRVTRDRDHWFRGIVITGFAARDHLFRGIVITRFAHRDHA